MDWPAFKPQLFRDAVTIMADVHSTKRRHAKAVMKKQSAQNMDKSQAL